MPLTFSFRKTTQALNFFARRSGGRINKMKALKLLYFADRFHLRKYGRPITNDMYFAMSFGPVASGAKDLAEGSEFRPDVERDYAERFLHPQDYDVGSRADIDREVFSETDLEALGFAWERFGGKDKYALAEITHVYPEWTKHAAALEGGVNSRVEMSYRDFLDDPPAGFDPCHPLDEETRQIRREETQELSAIHALWN
ncbi:MAG: SocA family protein [Verrucomicrobiae bacterium]|nr:SocA family protein [Verrucomicrobiae bacterium]